MTPDKPSDTAVGVALGVVATMLDPATRQLFPVSGEPYFEWFIEEHSDAARKQLEDLRSEQAAPLMEFLREAAAPGAALFTVLRKLFVEKRVRAALESGAQQLVILGGGYDPLTLRLQREYPQARFYELDHPATQEIKRRALEKRGILVPGVSWLPLDFAAESAEEKLLATDFDIGIRSVFVCEGVLMYLALAKVDELFALIRRLSGPLSGFVFTMTDKQVLETDPHATRLAKMVERNGEALLSSHCPAEMNGFLGERGFQLLMLGDRAALQTEFLLPRRIDRPVRNLEFAVSAQVDEHQ